MMSYSAPADAVADRLRSATVPELLPRRTLWPDAESGAAANDNTADHTVQIRATDCRASTSRPSLAPHLRLMATKKSMFGLDHSARHVLKQAVLQTADHVSKQKMAQKSG
jgi:hypothetical protein